MEQIKVSTLLTKDIRGKIVCFPTDTVYGIGALIDDDEAIQKIFALKKRDADKPLAILTATKDIKGFVKMISKDAKRLMDERWPGNITLIFEKNEHIKSAITKGFPTVAFRMPAGPTALKILKHFGLMAVTSVNISGQKELNCVADIINQFGDAIDYIVIDQEELSGVPSEIYDVTIHTTKRIR